MSFTPRPASGAKDGRTSLILYRRLFQSAPRERGESLRNIRKEAGSKVSIRAPRAGRKVLGRLPRAAHGSFNPRPASGAKDDAYVEVSPSGTVSIRAPRAGRKPEQQPSLAPYARVSIRAPRAGRKAREYLRIPFSFEFQSAPRERGESCVQ